MRRLISVTVGLLVAIAAAVLVLPILVLFDPAMRESIWIASLRGLDGLADAESVRSIPALFMWPLWNVVVAVCVLPVVLAALVGDIAHLRGFAWYAGAAGFFAAPMPWVIAAPLPEAESMRGSLSFFLVGVLAGAVYWALAGRWTAPDRNAMKLR